MPKYGTIIYVKNGTLAPGSDSPKTKESRRKNGWRTANEAETKAYIESKGGNYKVEKTELINPKKDKAEKKDTAAATAD